MQEKWDSSGNESIILHWEPVTSGNSYQAILPLDVRSVER